MKKISKLFIPAVMIITLLTFCLNAGAADVNTAEAVPVTGEAASTEEVPAEEPVLHSEEGVRVEDDMVDMRQEATLVSAVASSIAADGTYSVRYIILIAAVILAVSAAIVLISKRKRKA